MPPRNKTLLFSEVCLALTLLVRSLAYPYGHCMVMVGPLFETKRQLQGNADDIEAAIYNAILTKRCTTENASQ